MTLERAVQLPDLSQLPPWAVIAFGISLAIIVGLAWVGERCGKNGNPANLSNTARVAAVIVDPTALNAAAGEVSGLALAVHELVVVLKEAALQSKRTAEELDAIREELRIHREVNRR